LGGIRGLIGRDFFGGFDGRDLGLRGFVIIRGFPDYENTPRNIFPVYLEVFDGYLISGSDVGKSAVVPSNIDDRFLCCINFYFPVLSSDGQFACIRTDADRLTGDMNDFKRLPFRSRRLFPCCLLGQSFLFRLLGTRYTGENQWQQEADEVSTPNCYPSRHKVSPIGTSRLHKVCYQRPIESKRGALLGNAPLREENLEQE
jgi:hypothetical protein